MKNPVLKSLVVVTLLCGTVSAEPLWVAQNFSNNGFGSFNNNLPPLQGRVVTAPAGSFLSASLQTPVSSETARVGERFNAILGNDLAAGGQIVLPAGSQLEAQVLSVTPAGRAGRNGELDIRFTAAMLPNGQRVPLSGRIQTEDGSGLIKGGTATGRLGRAAVRTGVGAGLGAALGTAMGPLSGGRVGRGAVYGTALGSGLGALAAAAQKGNEAVLQSGQALNVVLDQPLTVAGNAGLPPINNNNGFQNNGFQQGTPVYQNNTPANNWSQQQQQQPYNPYAPTDSDWP